MTVTSIDELLRKSKFVPSKHPRDERGRWIMYHGTSADNAASIEAHGFDIMHATKGDTLLRAIYLTPNKKTAQSYANRSKKGAVVEVHVDPGRVGIPYDVMHSAKDVEWKGPWENGVPVAYKDAITAEAKKKGIVAVREDEQFGVFDPSRLHVVRQKT